MKPLLYFFITCVFFVTACKKNSGDSPAPAGFKGYFRGKLNGIFFNDTTSATILNNPPNGIHITGFHPNGSIKLMLKNFSGTTAEYLVNPDNMVFVGNSGGQFYAGFINGKMQGSGKINILEITDSYIKGSFESITPADSMHAILPPQLVSEGEFKIKKP